jgi:hypothetical protein
MTLQEKISKQLKVPYVYLPNHHRFICENGVSFTLEEFKKGMDIKSEYPKRSSEGELYDYNYARSKGLLRKIRDKKETDRPVIEVQNTVQDTGVVLQEKNEESREKACEYGCAGEKAKPAIKERLSKAGSNKSIYIIVSLLAFTSFISMYISTLHTATYLTDYVDLISAWLMSASVTAYNGTAFEVSVIFKKRKRYGLTFVFITLWTMVTVFSMTTTVSVFYDRFNFTESEIAQENKELDSTRFTLELLQKKEKDLRESIEFKKKDIEYRQEKEFATTAVRNELTTLQDELQKNLTEQQELLSRQPEVKSMETKRKESLFTFMGRLLHIDSGILEFIMSTLSAIFVNLIAPLSLTAVVELVYKKE